MLPGRKRGSRIGKAPFSAASEKSTTNPKECLHTQLLTTRSQPCRESHIAPGHSDFASGKAMVGSRKAQTTGGFQLFPGPSKNVWRNFLGNPSKSKSTRSPHQPNKPSLYFVQEHSSCAPRRSSTNRGVPSSPAQPAAPAAPAAAQRRARGPTNDETQEGSRPSTSGGQPTRLWP